MTDIKPSRNIRKIKLSKLGLDKVRGYSNTNSREFKTMYSGYAEMVAKALVGEYGRVTVDDIREVFKYYDIELVGNLWNSFFKKSNTNWVSVGQVSSTRKKAKGRSITVWILG